MNEKTIFYSLLGLVIFASGGTAVYMKIRGIRNNNPGNIRHGENWEGMRPIQTDASFIQFTDPVRGGIRAVNRILRTYKKYGINTIAGVVTRWAPPGENDTASYIKSVAGSVGVDPEQKIDIQEYAPEITLAIIKHENGVQPYSLAQIDEGVRLGWA